MRWLRSQYTGSELENIWRHSKQIRGASHAEAVFKEVTGDDFSSVEQQYFDVAAEFFAPFDIVEPPTIPRIVRRRSGCDLYLRMSCLADTCRTKCKTSKGAILDTRRWFRRFRYLLQRHPPSHLLGDRPILVLDAAKQIEGRARRDT